MQFTLAGVAQSVEQLICNQPVAGSSPIASSIFLPNFGGQPWNNHDVRQNLAKRKGEVPERSKGTDCKSVG